MDCPILNCLKCSAQGQQCEQCENGYQLDQSGQCLQKCGTIPCNTNQICISNNQCMQCKINERNVNYMCQCVGSGHSCNDTQFCSTTSQCQNCQLYMKNCRKCTDSSTCTEQFFSCKDQNCMQCPQNPNKCTNCVSGYAPNPAGQCILVCNVENCAKCHLKDICDACIDNFSLISNRCVNESCTDKHCVVCAKSRDYCEICSADFTNINGKCQEDCAKCNFDEICTNDGCQRCKGDSIVRNNHCVCSGGQSCADSEICTREDVLTRSEVSININGSDYTGIAKSSTDQNSRLKCTRCELLIPHCSECITKQICMKCHQSYVIQENKCVSEKYSPLNALLWSVIALISLISIICAISCIIYHCKKGKQNSAITGNVAMIQHHDEVVLKDITQDRVSSVSSFL